MKYQQKIIYGKNNIDSQCVGLNDVGDDANVKNLLIEIFLKFLLIDQPRHATNKSTQINSTHPRKHHKFEISKRIRKYFYKIYM